MNNPAMPRSSMTAQPNRVTGQCSATPRRSRRWTLKAALTTGLATVLARPLAALADDLPYLDRIGLQLYTVRNQMQENADTTLSAIAEAGYRQVELMSIDSDAVKIASMARDKGLMVHSAFMDWKAIVTPGAEGVTSVDQTIELAERIGLRHVVFGYIGRDARDTADKCKRIAAAANVAAQKTRGAGMRMCYHNHSFEFGTFEGSELRPSDIFIKEFDPQLMNFELDVFWVKIGGADPIEIMKRLAGRITQIHLKDLKEGVGTIHDESKVPPDAFEELGDGVIEIGQIMKLAKEIGVQECHVEQDQSPAPLESIVQSLQYLTGNIS